MYKIKAISSLEKVMPTDNADKFVSLTRLRGLRGERVSFQIVISYVKDGPCDYFMRGCGKFEVHSSLKKHLNMSRVGFVPVMLPAYTERSDYDYISKAPGMFPDVLYPLKHNDELDLQIYTPTVLMAVVDIPEDCKPGTHKIEFVLTAKSGQHCNLIVDIDVEALTIKKNDLIFTQWFHSDCIADYFHVKMMSEKHWKLIEAFIKTAARTGITMLLTPLFTPALDTAIGAERPTMQLIGITKKGKKYSFDFTLLERWVSMCHKYGIEHFEMTHLFTQWGAAKCPKIIVNIDEKDVKEFGWHTDAMCDAYKNFLSQFLPALTKKLRDMGIADKTYFHISDEPSPDAFDSYMEKHDFVAPFLKGFKVIDALSHVEFFQKGIVKYPVCSTSSIEPFLEEDIPERWCYYCCSQGNWVGNRFIAMPSYRNRILGVQMYLADIKGFLQWGFNFYNTALSKEHIDPYRVTDSDMAFPAGDPFSVYPYKNSAIESIRTVVFYQAIQDRMLLKMLEEKIGKDEVQKLIEEYAGEKITFKEYPRNNVFLESLHDRIIELLAK